MEEGCEESSGNTSPEWGHFRCFTGNQEDLISSGNIFNESITGDDFRQRKSCLIFLIWSPAGTGWGCREGPRTSRRTSFLDEKTASPFCKHKEGRDHVSFKLSYQNSRVHISTIATSPWLQRPWEEKVKGTETRLSLDWTIMSRVAHFGFPCWDTEANLFSLA